MTAGCECIPHFAGTTATENRTIYAKICSQLIHCTHSSEAACLHASNHGNPVQHGPEGEHEAPHHLKIFHAAPEACCSAYAF